MSREFLPLFLYKLYLGPNEQANVISRNFLVFAKIFAKNVLCEVIDYTGTVSV